MSGPIHQWADGLLPIEALVDVVALEIIPAGEAQKGGVHRRHLLHQINAKSVGAVVIGWRKQRNEIEPEGAGMRNGQGEMIGGRRRNIAGLERELSTASTPCLNPRRLRLRPALPLSSPTRLIVTGPMSAGRGLGVERPFVFSVGANRNAPVARR